MIKFIIPAIIIFLIVLFWENINEFIYKKFNIKINYIVAIIIVVILGIIFALLYFWFVNNKKDEKWKKYLKMLEIS